MMVHHNLLDFLVEEEYINNEGIVEIYFNGIKE